MKIKSEYKSLLIHALLFVFTFISCMVAGYAWDGRKNLSEIFDNFSNIFIGFQYALLLMIFLTAHEMGHYLASRIHKVKCTLPYYIPFPPTTYFPLSFGTMGAIIRMKEQIPSRKALLDIGASGPIAGFIVAMMFLIYGLATLPTISFLYSIHPNYNINEIPANSLFFGNNLIYYYSSILFANSKGFLPPMSEIYHYPFLNVGWFGLFVTALNMLPIGQLDGGHVTAAMFGRKLHLKIAKITWWIILVIGLSAVLLVSYQFLISNDSGMFLKPVSNALLPFLAWLKEKYPILMLGWGGWLFWAILTKFVIKLGHPPVFDETPLDNRRMIVGWIAILIFLGSFSLTGIYIF